MSEYVFCCVSRGRITQSLVRDLHSVAERMGLSVQGEKSLATNGSAIDILLNASHAPNENALRYELMSVAAAHQLDIALLNEGPERYDKKLVVFDMDSTLIEQEVIDEMAKVYGVGEKVQKITERAMNGELNFDQALQERVALLKGFKREHMEKILASLKPNEGVEQFIKIARNQRIKTAIASGGFIYFAENLKKRLDMDYAFANELLWDGDVLSGEISGSIVNAERKAQILTELAQKENLSLHQIVAVGDGANDIPMLNKAGLGIAYHAKERVRKIVKHHVSYGPMTSALYYLGIPGEHNE